MSFDRYASSPVPFVLLRDTTALGKPHRAHAHHNAIKHDGGETSVKFADVQAVKMKALTIASHVEKAALSTAQHLDCEVVCRGESRRSEWMTCRTQGVSQRCVAFVADWGVQSVDETAASEIGIGLSPLSKACGSHFLAARLKRVLTAERVAL
jgi:hypothetical protein